MTLKRIEILKNFIVRSHEFNISDFFNKSTQIDFIPPDGHEVIIIPCQGRCVKTDVYSYIKNNKYYKNPIMDRLSHVSIKRYKRKDNVDLRRGLLSVIYSSVWIGQCDRCGSIYHAVILEPPYDEYIDIHAEEERIRKQKLLDRIVRPEDVALTEKEIRKLESMDLMARTMGRVYLS